MLQTHVLGQGVNRIKLFKIGLSTFCATTLRTLTSCPHATRCFCEPLTSRFIALTPTDTRPGIIRCYTQYHCIRSVSANC